MLERERVRKVRLFAAVEIPEPVREQVRAAVAPLQRRHHALRWTDPQGWHLTLAFLGWVPEERLAAVQGALARAASTSAPLTMALTGDAGSFRGGVLWAGVEPQPALDRLAATVERELAEVVALPDAGRPFHPHLTLARARGRPSQAREAADAYVGPTESWPVDRLVLMRSHLSKTGARYQVVSECPLLGAADT